MTTPEARLAALGITLPDSAPPAGNYATCVEAGGLLFVSARAPRAAPGEVLKGRLGDEYTAEQGYAMARSAAVELLAAVKAHAGALARIERFAELQGFLNTTPEFEQHAEVLDGASDLFAAVLGPDAGLHARSVVGVATLRKGLPLTIRAVLQLRPEA